MNTSWSPMSLQFFTSPVCPYFVSALATFVNKEKTGGVIRAIAGKQAEFVSETSEANVMVKWYKNGKEITTSKKFTMEDKGKLHKLVASAVTKEDEGTYICKIGDDTLIFDLKVSGKLVGQTWDQNPC